MIEKDDIQELFSKSLENHTTPVRPEVWTGLQAKMAAAGLTTAAGVTAAKGMSVITKWIIGGAAAVTTTVATTLIVMNQDEPTKKDAPAKELAAESTTNTQAEEPVTATEGKQSEAARLGDPRVTEPGGQQEFVWVNPAPGSVMPTPAFDPQDYVVVIDHTNHDPAVVADNNGSKAPEDPKKGNDPEVVEDKTPPLLSKPNFDAVTKVIELPNVFTPDGDGVNDVYNIRENVELVSENDLSVTIMNASNKTVFTSTDPNFKWDGDQAPAGKYICIVIGTYKDGRSLKVVQSFEIRK